MSRASPEPLRVWDLPVRVLHWALVVACALATLSLWWPALGPWHLPAGYATLVIVLLRLAWAGLGSRHARFAGFIRPPRATAAYLRLLVQRREPRHVGHNPLGGWMVCALFACLAGLALTGWLYTTDRFWGDEQIENLHRALAWVLLGLVVLHVAGVVFTGRRHRENLIRAMVDGRKRAPQGDDVG